MNNVEKYVTWVTLTFCGCCVLVLVAAIVSPDFRDNSAGLVIGVLGAITSFGGMLRLGSYFAKGIKEAPEEEAKRADAEEGIS